MHDLVIENATLVDGLGNPAVAGALAVKDGRIAALGADLGKGAQRLDAEGLTLAPGIVGLHGVWVNGRRTLGAGGPLADCGRPGRLLQGLRGLNRSADPASAARNRPGAAAIWMRPRINSAIILAVDCRPITEARPGDR